MKMIEKIAIAIFAKKNGIKSVAVQDSWAKFSVIYKEGYRELGKAGIEAMKEATEEMIDEAFNGPSFRCADKSEIKTGYIKMIEAALKE